MLIKQKSNDKRIVGASGRKYKQWKEQNMDAYNRLLFLYFMSHYIKIIYDYVNI